jgi:serine/threonine-protein kinase HipA
MVASQLYLWWLGDVRTRRLIGTLRLLMGAGPQANGVSLEYHTAWLQNGFALSEDLPLRAGEALPRERGCAAGAVDDARPDRWGERVIRHLIQPPRLSTLDFLYFAGDQRFGALGVSSSPNEYQPFADDSLPSIDDVPAIYQLIQAIENGEPVSEPLKRLLAPGATLGGARPKALVLINDEPWVIKFAEYGDVFDSPAIEYAAMTMARSAGIDSCETRLLAFESAGKPCHALLVKRFDRENGLRRHALSAKVALSAVGSAYGYPELALLLRRRGDAQLIERNGEQIFRRMVFNMLIDNTDDHEKNHALLVRSDGLMELAPAFDVLPSGLGLGYQQMRVGKLGSISTLENALSDAAAFRMKRPKALAIVNEVTAAVKAWRNHFRAAGVSEKDIASLGQYLDGSRLLN